MFVVVLETVSVLVCLLCLCLKESGTKQPRRSTIELFAELKRVYNCCLKLDVTKDCESLYLHYVVGIRSEKTFVIV